MLQGASQLNAKLVQLEERFDGIAKQVAAESVPDVEKAVRADSAGATVVTEIGVAVRHGAASCGWVKGYRAIPPLA